MSKSSPVKVAEAKASPAEKQKSIDNHKKAATHFQAAAKHHLDASKHHEADDHHKAASSLIAANGHQITAREIQKEELVSHAKKAMHFVFRLFLVFVTHRKGKHQVIFF
jgi:hypothetical protein